MLVARRVLERHQLAEIGDPERQERARVERLGRRRRGVRVDVVPGDGDRVSGSVTGTRSAACAARRARLAHPRGWPEVEVAAAGVGDRERPLGGAAGEQVGGHERRRDRDVGRHEADALEPNGDDGSSWSSLAIVSVPG